jgi:hypothetical protein
MTEESLPGARRLLDKAVASLIDPRPTTHEGRVVWMDSVYTELRDAIHGHKAGSSRSPSEPQPPLWIDGVDLANDIDSEVRRWERNGTGHQHPTVNRLRHINARKWRPQDVDIITRTTVAVEGWVKRYSVLVDQKPLTLPNPCPECGKKWAYRRQDNERVRVPALQVTPEKCVCQACRIEWPADRFGLLARELGYDPLPGVIA